METSRTTKQAVNQQWSHFYWAGGWKRHEITAERVTAQWSALKAWEEIAGKEWRKEIELTRERESSRQMKANGWWKWKYGPVRDNREKKSYGKENCSCGKGKTTQDRVSLFYYYAEERKGEIQCMCVCRESFLLCWRWFLQSRAESSQICLTNDSLMTERLKGFAGLNGIWGKGRGKNNQPHNEWQKIHRDRKRRHF